MAKGLKVVDTSCEVEYPCRLEKKELPMLTQTKVGFVVSITVFPCRDLAVMRPSTCLYSMFRWMLAYGGR